MKVISKEVKECEVTSGKKETVLDLQYSHKWEKWQILVRDYHDSMYSYILKQLKSKVRDAYNEQKLKSEA